MAGLLGRGALLLGAVPAQSETAAVSVGIVWLRGAFRLDDHPMLVDATRDSDALLIVAERSPGKRAGLHRRRFHFGSLGALDQGLHVLCEAPADDIPRLAERMSALDAPAAMPPPPSIARHRTGNEYPPPIVEDPRWAR